MEKRLYFQKQLVNNIGEENLPNFLEGNCGSNLNDGGSLQNNMKQLEDISVDFGSDQCSIDSVHRIIDPEYGHLVNKEDSLAHINLEHWDKESEEGENEEEESEEGIYLIFGSL